MPEIHKCSCGAVGIKDKTGEVKFAKDLETLNRITGLNLILDNAIEVFICDYCANHYGLDLCSCGSGEPVGECGCGSHDTSAHYNRREKRVLWAY